MPRQRCFVAAAEIVAALEIPCADLPFRQVFPVPRRYPPAGIDFISRASMRFLICSLAELLRLLVFGKLCLQVRLFLFQRSEPLVEHLRRLVALSKSTTASSYETRGNGA
jgi:hypothetical protein